MGTADAATALVFDTNALLFAFTGSPRLSKAAEAAMSRTDLDRVVSTASYYEVALKHRAGRLSVSADQLDRAVRASGLRAVAPSASVMTRAAGFEWDVRDPWDRIIAATAVEVADGLTVTRDAAFDRLDAVERVW